MKKLILNLVLVISLFTSCSKKIEQLAGAEKQIKLVRYGSTNAGFREYTYKGNLMIQEKYSGNSSNFPTVSTFSYESSGKLKEIRIDFLGKAKHRIQDYIFEKERPIRSKTYDDGTKALLAYRLMENSAGMVVEKSFSKDDVLTQKDEFNLTADGRNFTSKKSFSGSKLTFTTNNLKFDDKKSPFKLFPNGYFSFTNTNNAFNVDFIFENTANNQSVQNTLEYNEMGYPVKEIDKNGVVGRIFEYVIE